MLTSGEILKNSRLEKHLELKDIEKDTKIRLKYLEALEKGNLEKLPGEIYVQGFVKNYAEYLGLSVNSILAVLRREYFERKKKEILPSGIPKPLLDSSLIINRLSFPASFLIGLLFLFIYLFLQYQNYQKPPLLLLDSPKQNRLTVKNDKYLFSGKTDKDNRLLINGQELTLLDNGKFQEIISLASGVNEFVITAISNAGKENTQKKTIIKIE